jgi:hypothetical protein
MLRCGLGQRASDLVSRNVEYLRFRATILALDRFGVAAREPALALQKTRSAYRKTAGLDLYGHAATSEPSRLPGCAHAD